MTNRFFETEKIVGLGLVSLGALLFLYSLHILTISSTDNIFIVLNTLFTILMWLVTPFAGLIVFVLLIRLIKYSIWLVKTPASKRNDDEDDDE